MRWRAVVLGCALTCCLGTGAQAQSNISTVDVPIGVPTPNAAPAPTAGSGLLATPAPLPSGMGITSSDWSFQEVPAAQWLDGLTSQLLGAFSNIMNRSVQLAQALFYALAVAEFGWATCRWAFSSTPLEEVVAEAYFKAVRMALLYILIGCTFTLPGGGPGWFPLIVGGIISMAQTAAGVSVIPSQYSLNGSLNLAAGFSPGDVFTFFWNIAIFVIKSAFTQQSIGNLLVGAFTGATAIWMVTAGIAALSGIGVMLLGVYVSFKYFLTLFKAYLVASQAYLQGFLGSSKTASNGSGLFNAALNLGIEMGALVVIMGVFKSFLSLALNLMSLGFLVIQNSTAGTQYGPAAGGSQLGSIAPEGVRLVAVLLLDVLVVLWAYAVKTIPEQAASALSGRLDVRPEEFLAHAQSSFTPSKALGAVAAVAGGGLGVKMLSGSSSGGAPTMSDRASGAAKGALQGALFAGPGGALGGALMGAMSAKSAQPSGADEGTIAGGASPGASTPFANREFAPKGGAATNPTPSSAGGTAGGAEADGADERELVGAGTGGSRGGASAKRGGTGSGGVVVDGASMRVSHSEDRLDDAGGQTGTPPVEGHGATDVPNASAQNSSGQVAGSETVIGRSPDRVTDSGRGGGADAGGRVTDAEESAQGFESTSTGGSGDNTTTSPSGGKQGGTGGAAQSGSDHNAMRDLTSALRDTTAALRAHRFGGSAGGASGGGGGGGSTSGGDAGGASGGDPIFGGGTNAMNPLNIMMYRKLLGAGAPPAPRIAPEHPSATIDAGSLVN